MWVFIFGSIATAICVLLSKRNDAEYVRQEEVFFETMATPVDFESEIGTAFDGRQLIVMGNASLVLGSLLGLIVLIPNPLWGRLLAAGIAGSIISIGALLKRQGNATSA